MKPLAGESLQPLLKDVAACQVCEAHLPYGPRPIVQAHPDAKIMIIGQAPGQRVHTSGIPWDDPSGDRLRQWLQLDKSEFYDATKIAIMPMGFCYPGKGTSGDLPPRKECAPLWHPQLLQHLPNIKLTLLIGQYAQNRYCPEQKGSLTDRVKQWQEYAPDRLPLPHPSPRNRHWFAKNPWFEKEVVPWLRQRTAQLLELA